MSLTWNLGPAEEIKHISVTVLFCMLLFFFEGCYTNIEFVLWVYPPMVSTLVGKMFFSPWNFWVPYFQLHPQGLRYRITYKMSSFINVDYYIYMFYIYICVIMLLLLMFDPNATLTEQKLWDATIEAGGFAVKKYWFQAHCGAPQCLMSLLLGYDETKNIMVGGKYASQSGGVPGWRLTSMMVAYVQWCHQCDPQYDGVYFQFIYLVAHPRILSGLYHIYILSLVLSGISTVNSLTTGVITYLLSGNHQVTTVIIIPRPWRSHDIPHESPR